MKKILMFCMACSCYFCSYGQAKLQADLSNYADSMKTVIKTFLSSKKNLRGYLNEITDKNFVFIPYCSLNIDSIANVSLNFRSHDLQILEDKLGSHNIFSLITLVKDSTGVSYRMYYVNNYFIVMPTFASRPHFINGSISKDKSILNYPIFQMYMQARKKSNYVFALRIEDGFNPYTGQITGYTEGNKLGILGMQTGGGPLEEFENLGQFIQYKYGGLYDYVQEVKDEKSVNLPVMECKKILRESYYWYEKMYPKDTTTIMNMFICEFDSLAKHKTITNDSLSKYLLDSIKGCDTVSWRDYYSAELLNRKVDGYLDKLLPNILTRRRQRNFNRLYWGKRIFEQKLFRKIVHDYEDRHMEDMEKGFGNAFPNYEEFYRKEFELIFTDGDD